MRALEAGVDAICLGHDLPLEPVHAAVEAALESGRLSADRLAASAVRLAKLGRGLPTPNGMPRTAVGAEAARRALQAEGDVHVAEAPLVVELVTTPNIAAGPRGAWFGELVSAALARRAVRAPRPSRAAARGRRPSAGRRPPGCGAPRLATADRKRAGRGRDRDRRPRRGGPSDRPVSWQPTEPAVQASTRRSRSSPAGPSRGPRARSRRGRRRPTRRGGRTPSAVPLRAPSPPVRHGLARAR